MIALNTYSFAIRMGLLGNKEKNWKLKDFLQFCKKKNIKKIEFPIDYFSKKENQNFEYFLQLINKNNLGYIIDLENFKISYVKKILNLSKKYPIGIIRVKMSNFFGGNRYKQKKFFKCKKDFITKLKKIDPLLKKSNVKVAIENHQDLTSSEILNIIKNLKSQKFGINWDIGNSLATCETPDQFFLNTKKYILNAHCKNYKIILSNKGFFLKRTTIDEGSINIIKYLNFFKKKNIDLSLELAAHINRHCDFRSKNFFKFHNINKRKLDVFKKYIEKNAFNETPFSKWEVYKKISLSAISELTEFNQSLKKIRKYE